MEVTAVGPVWRYGDDAKKAAASGGTADAKRPVWTGRPATLA
jgi:hypothetical protein